MNSELAVAKNTIKISPRLAIVILDNLIEVSLFNLIQDNAMRDYITRDKVKNAKQRLNLYSHFDEKVKYAVKSEIIDQDAGVLISIFHKIRNRLSHYGQVPPIADKLADYYFGICNEFLSSSLNARFTLSKSNILSQALKEDLLHRFKKIKADIGEACMADRNFDELALSNEDIDGMLEHIFSNYGEAIIEKSNFKSELKERYIDSFINDGAGFNEFFNIEELWKIERSVTKYSWKIDLPSLNEWNKVDGQISLLEEILDLYVLIAC